MNINRHNYEELFLLYIDGEMNAEQKQMVEAFAEANPDLKEELDMLKETVLFADSDNDLVFADKSSLYKSFDAAVITTNNYEEHFLLYVDNELNLPAKAAVETFVLQHPELQDQFTVLKQTKLEAEHIACPDKELLYKEEKERRPVIFMWAKRLSIAAAILLFAVMAWLFTSNNKKTVDGPSVAVTSGTIEKKSVPTVTSPTVDPLSTGTKENDNADDQQPQQSIQHSLADAATQKNKAVEKIPVTKNEPEQKIVPSNTIAKVDNSSNNNSLTAAQPQQKQEAIIAAITPNKNNEQTVHTVASSNKLDNTNNAINTKIANTNTASLIAQPTVYRELNTADEDDESKSVYIGSMQISKTKLNGLLKKAKKIFVKSKNEDAPTEESPSAHSRTLR